jgi:ADP-ribosylglycohydrolase
MGKHGSRLYDKVYGCLLGGLIGDAAGAPAEGMDWREVERQFGRITDFSGAGTDDSAIKQILCEAIIENGGHITADEFADSFLRNKGKYYNLFFIPVRNMVHKLEAGLVLPIDAGYGNMHSSSSAMSISPIGIINACNPRQASAEAFEAAGLIHSGPSGFCRDGAAAIAAAVAEAMKESATAASVVCASHAFLHARSGADMAGEIRKVAEAASEINNYEAFRDWFYANCLRDIICNSLETVPCAIALFQLAGGDPETAIVYAANLGRDADTIGTMAGAIAGAFKGASGLPDRWIGKIEGAGGTEQKTSSHYGGATVTLTDQRVLAERLTEAIGFRMEEARQLLAGLESMS